MAQIQKGTTYSTGDQVTATNLNALADAAILLPGAITDQTAKTVPLAADTVLIHSAADTALRKSTLTQLFANATGIPISTGISGLGTGIATALAINTGSAGAPVLFNGALGTPSSGTVTNLTGTASININGTVGATTANTGAFTTLSASGKITSTSTGELFLSNTATTQALYLRWLNTGGNLYFGRESSAGGTLVTGAAAYSVVLNNEANQPVYIASNNAIVGTFSSTGLAVTGALSSTTGANFATSSGSVGVGTSSPSYKLDVRVTGTGNVANFQSDGGPNIRFTGTETSGRTYQIGEGLVTAGSFSIYDTTGSAERLVINSSGNVGIGVTPSAWDSTNKALDLGARTCIASTNSGSSSDFTNNGYITAGTYIYKETAAASFYRQSAGAHSWFTAASGTAGNAISFTQAMTLDASGNLGVGVTSLEGRFEVRGGNLPSTHSFLLGYGANGDNYYTSGASGVQVFRTGGTERARFDSSGNLLVGKTADVLANAGCLLDNRGSFTFTRDGATVGYINRLSSNGELLSFLIATTQVGSISYNGTLTLYNQTSDYRLKDITGPLTDSGAFIDALKPKVGTWKSSGNKFVGFVAHEFAEVSPTSVTGKKDDVDSDGNPVYQGMQASTPEVIANLVAELQSVRQRLAALENS
jgi:hypothetical protein